MRSNETASTLPSVAVVSVQCACDNPLSRACIDAANRSVKQDPPKRILNNIGVD